jgi:hypothetical protein
MKAILISLCTLVLPSILIAQDFEGMDEYNLLLIKDSKFEVLAERNGEKVVKTTKEAHVKLNHVSGAFYCGVQQKDLQLFTDEEFPEDMERAERPYFYVKGTMPMDQIQGNDHTDQQYDVEMSISIFEQEIPLVFQVNVKNYQQTNVGFWAIIGAANLDTRDLGITEFHGYDPEIKIIFSFQAYTRRN